MSIKRLSLAAAILFSLTACGSGGGSDNARTNNDLANLTKELTQANENLAKKEKEAQAAREAKAVAEANNEKTKTDLANLTKQLTQANENLAQKEKEAQAAQEAKVKAEAALLAAKTPLTKAEIYQLAIRSGLSNGSAEELARDLVGKTKEEVSDAVILNTRISKILTLAQNYGYTEQEAKTFESANRDKSFDDLVNLLSKEATDKQNARAALIAELKQLALDKGLQEWEADNFAYNYVNQGKETALVELGKLVERNNFIKELIQLAKEKGLDDWEANNFANNNASSSKEAALASLNDLVRKKEEEIIRNAKNVSWAGVNNVADAPLGFTAQYGRQETPAYDSSGKEIGKNVSYVDVYNQKYSLLVGKYSNNLDYELYEVDTVNLGGGLRTTDAQLPVAGMATYKGVAFGKDGQGTLEYTINFGEKQGNGAIKGLAVGDLVLEKGELYKAYGREWQTAGNVTGQGVTGKYETILFGPNAEEITGQANLDVENVDQDAHSRQVVQGYGADVAVGFGGTRGEIQK